MYQGSAVDLGTTPGPGPFAACHSPSHTLFPVTLFSCTVNKARKGQKNIKKKKTYLCPWPTIYSLKWLICTLKKYLFCLCTLLLLQTNHIDCTSFSFPILHHHIHVVYCFSSSGSFVLTLCYLAHFSALVSNLSFFFYFPPSTVVSFFCNAKIILCPPESHRRAV